MTADELEAIEQRAQEATAGPWHVDPMDLYVMAPDGSPVASKNPSKGYAWMIRGSGAEKAGHRPRGSQDANGAFIANAREDVPRLIAELRRLRDELQHTRELRSSAQRQLEPFLIREAEACAGRDKLQERLRQMEKLCAVPDGTVTPLIDQSENMPEPYVLVSSIREILGGE